MRTLLALLILCQPALAGPFTQAIRDNYSPVRVIHLSSTAPTPERTFAVYYANQDNTEAARTDYDVSGPFSVVPDSPVLGPDRVIFLWSKSCVHCPEAKYKVLQAISKLVRVHPWTFGEYPSRHFQFVDVDEYPKFAETVADVWGEDPGVPFLAKIENNRIVRAWDGQSELDQWTLGYISKGVDERPQELDAGQQPTQWAEVDRVLKILRPESHETFVDYGCGDGRFLIAAARDYGCQAVGVEIDPVRAAAAKTKVREAGLEDKVDIIVGDATKVDVDADVGVAYLWPETLIELRPKLKKLNRFVSYQHVVPGLTMTKYNDAYFWEKPAPVVYQKPATQYVTTPNSYYSTRVSSSRSNTAVWNGRAYSAPVCNSPNCTMCNSIRRQLSSQSRTRRW